MKILLSPAKSLEWEKEYPQIKISKLHFAEEAEYLIGKLQKLSTRQVKKLMSLSDALAELNVKRYNDYFHNEKRPAIFSFDGDVYKGLDAFNLSNEAIERSQNCLRILSGLYGIIKPFDAIAPYRLEMGTSLKVTAAKTNLYKYWDSKVVDALKQELDNENELIVNAASQEYAKVVTGVKNHGLNILDVEFKENKGGDYKIVGFFAKKARGMFARFVLEENINDKESLKDFNFDGYSYNSKLSETNNYIFTR